MCSVGGEPSAQSRNSLFWAPLLGSGTSPQTTSDATAPRYDMLGEQDDHDVTTKLRTLRSDCLCGHRTVMIAQLSSVCPPSRPDSKKYRERY
jgi:hypothetical protein